MSEFFRINSYPDNQIFQPQGTETLQAEGFFEEYIPPVFNFENNTQNETPEYELPDLSGKQWQSASLKEENVLGIKTGYFIYTTTNGTTIKLKDIEDVTVVENSQTGEIVIIGADNSIINTGNTHSKISIYDSCVDSITGNKYDEDISLYGSYFNDINTKGGNDTITMLDSEGRRIETGTGEDNLNVIYSEIFEYLEMGEGNDIASFNNSESDTCNADLGFGNDFIYSKQSELKNIDTSTGEDKIYVDSTQIDNISTGEGNDFAIIKDSEIHEGFNSGKGNDAIEFSNSTSATFDAGKGDNTIIWQDSSVESQIINGENNTIKNSLNIGGDLESEIEKLDDASYDTSQSVSNNITSQYTDKELTTEEELQLLFINDFVQNAQNMRIQFENQENEDGILNDGYNVIKAWLDIGVSKEDIEDALIKQEQYSNELLAAFNGESDESFEEAFKRITGVEYNQENVIHWQEISQKYDFALVGIQKAENFKECIKEASNLQETFDLYVNYFGSEETAREEMNKMLAKMQANVNYYGCSTIWKEGYPYSFDFGETKMYINEKNQFIIESKEETLTWEISNIESNPFGGTFVGEDSLDIYANEFITDYEKIMGLSFKDLQEEYAFSQIETFGKGNAFQQLIDDYCQQQEGYADKLSLVTTFAGMGIIFAGGIVTCVNPFVGLSMMNIGGKVAFAGSLVDNGYDLIDNLTSENGLEKEELYDLLQETAVELALYYSGKGIGKLTQPINTKVLELTGSESLALLAEVGPDAVMSLLVDAMITGEVDLTGEGISQLIQIVAGLAGVRGKIKIDGYIKEADKLFLSKGIVDATEYLKKIGMPEKMLANYENPRLKQLVFEKVVPPGTGSINKLYAQQIGKLTNAEMKYALELIDKGIPVSKAADTAVLMQKHATRINELINNPNINKYYIADLARLNDAQYNAALRAINEKGITAPSAIDRARDLAKNFDATSSEIISSGKMRLEVTPEIEAELISLAQELSFEYKENSANPKNMFLEILFGEGVSKMPEDSEYEYFSSRTKGDNSSLCKLITKYEKGDLKIDLANHNLNLTAARSVITDAYGTRLQLKNLSAGDVTLALKAQGFTGKNALNDFTQALLENSQKGTALSEEYAAVLDALKEQHNEPVFKALMSAIENDKINLDELNNYGSRLSSYFTTKQIVLLADAYYSKHGIYPKIVTQDAEIVLKTTTEKINPTDLMSEENGAFVVKIEALSKSLIGDKAIKASGYTTSQMTYKLEIDGALYCLGEFQIRGTEVNRFGDVEHIPYDIRQGKITGKDVEYKNIYEAITRMSESSFEAYNQYLTQVYDYLRLKELGIDLGKMPSLESLKLTYESGEPIDPKVIKELSYKGLLKYSH